MYYGLGAHEDEVLATLPPKLRRIVENELDDPEARQEISKILRGARPAERLARELSETIEDAMRPAGDLADGGLGKFSLKKTFKKVAKTVRKVHAKITPKFVQKIEKKIKAPINRAGKAARRILVRYGNIIILVVAAILAPFTGGATLAAATALASAAFAMYKAKKAADEAKRAGKKEAAALQVQVQQQEADVLAQCNTIYANNKAVFEQIGITQSRWDSLSLEAKVAIIDALSKGQMPPGYSIVSEEEGAAAGITPDTPIGTQVTVPSSGSVSVPSAPPSGVSVPGAPDYGAPNSAPAPQSPSAPTPGGGGAGPYSSPYPTDQWYDQGAEPDDAAPVAGPTGKYELQIEGRSVGTAETSTEISNLIAKNAAPGDRVEVFLDGSSTGLKLMAKSGLISVPLEDLESVKAMGHAELVDKVARATAAAGGGSSSSFPWWVLAVPVVVYGASKAS